MDTADTYTRTCAGSTSVNTSHRKGRPGEDSVCWFWHKFYTPRCMYPASLSIWLGQYNYTSMSMYKFNISSCLANLRGRSLNVHKNLFLYHTRNSMFFIERESGVLFKASSRSFNFSIEFSTGYLKSTVTLLKNLPSLNETSVFGVSSIEAEFHVSFDGYNPKCQVKPWQWHSKIS